MLLTRSWNRNAKWKWTVPSSIWLKAPILYACDCGGANASISTCSSMWPSKMRRATRTNAKPNVKTEKMAHIHRKMDNKILLFASDIFKWSLFFLSFFRFDCGTNCFGRHADSIPDDIICTSPNLMCDRFIISFRFVCCQMVFVCFAFLVRPTTNALQIFVLLYCMGVCLIFCPLKSSRLFSLSLLFSQTVKKDGVTRARRSLAFVTYKYALSAISITPAMFNIAK